MIEPYRLVLSETAPLESGRYPGFGYKREVFDAFVKERDVAVPLRDGTTIYVDIYSPHDVKPGPVLTSWSPYGKHGLKSLKMMPGADVDPEWVSEHVIWEGPDPAAWCPMGYTIVIPDPRGAWSSEGTLNFFTNIEGEDGYDLIEWIAKQPFSNGKVGMLGVSYLAISQWNIASKRPPSLAAICPWEGLSDPYREVFFAGGIPEWRFLEWWQAHSRFSLSPAEDMKQMCADHPLLDDYWATKTFDLEAIDVPALVVAGWGDHAMHTRGTLDGFRRISSKQKWLQIHGQKKWRHFWHPESVAKQRAFFDHFLAGKETGIEHWPRVEYELRESNEKSTFETSGNWPLDNVKPLPLHLDCASGTLSTEPALVASQTSYEADRPNDTVTFTYRFEADMQITGGAKLRLWLIAEDHDEADVFVALRKLGPDGAPVGFRWWSMFTEGPIALGWLRASHRGLSPLSTDLQPIHTHRVREPLVPGKATALDIEIWPSCTLFRRGETLEVTIGANDLSLFNTGAPEPEHRPDNRGRYRILGGGEHDSHLLLPWIDPSPALEREQQAR